jgi:hypothetical protein
LELTSRLLYGGASWVLEVWSEGLGRHQGDPGPAADHGSPEAEHHTGAVRAGDRAKEAGEEERPADPGVAHRRRPYGEKSRASTKHAAITQTQPAPAAAICRIPCQLMDVAMPA